MAILLTMHFINNGTWSVQVVSNWMSSEHFRKVLLTFSEQITFFLIWQTYCLIANVFLVVRYFSVLLLYVLADSDVIIIWGWVNCLALNGTPLSRFKSHGSWCSAQQWKFIRNHQYLKRLNVRRHLSNFVVSTVVVDGLRYFDNGRLHAEWEPYVNVV